MTEIDPELAEDRDERETDIEEVTLPEFDAEQFELPEDFEFEGDDDD